MKVISMLPALLRATAVCALLFTGVAAPAQSYQYEIAIPNETWVHQSNKSTLDGGSIILTKSQATASASRYINLIKLDNTGNLQWQKSFGPFTCSFENIVQSPDSGYFLCATAFNAMSYMALKTDKFGNIQYTRRIQTPWPYGVFHEGEVIAKNDGSGFFISSTLWDSSTATQCWHLVQLDQYCMPVWSRVYDLNSTKTRCYSIDTCDNGDVLMMGSFFSSPFHWFKVLRVDKNNGAIVWFNRYKSVPASITFTPVDMICDTLDQIYVLSQSSSSLTPRTALTKIDSAGDVVWTMEYAHPSMALRPRTMMHTDTGDILMAGEEFFLRVDANGTIITASKFTSLIFDDIEMTGPQTVQFTGSDTFSLNTVVLSSDLSGNGCNDSPLSVTKTPRTLGDSAITGSIGLPLQDFVFNLPPVNKNIQLINNCEKTSSVEEPASQSLVQVFPNPADNQLTIRSAELIRSAEIFNVTGQSVLSQTKTTNEYQLDISGLSAGCYMVRVTLDSRVETYRVVIE